MTCIPLSRLLAALSLTLFFSLFATVSLAADNPPADAATYASLADILEDEDARERLILELREVAAGEGRTSSDPVADGSGIEATEEISMARRVATVSQGIAQSFVTEFSSGVAAIRELGSGGPSLDISGLISAATDLLVVIAATVGLFLVLRWMARPLFSMANRWALTGSGKGNLLRRLVAVVGSALIDLVIILLAYLSGYLLTLFALGEPGEMNTRESLFLNAFLLIEVFKATIRALFASRDDGLRLLPLTAEQAAYWNAWLARLTGFIGYGILLVVPVVNVNVSPAVGRMVALFIMGLAFLYALVIILQNRALVTERLETRARQADLGFNRLLLSMFAKSWYVLALAYFAALFVITLTRPDDALPFMLGASLQTLLAVGIGLFVSVLLSQFISSGFHVGEETRTRFPMLEDRLNGFLPNMMKVIRLAILIVVAGVVADAWALFSLAEWVASEAGSRALGTAVSVVIIITVAMVLWIGLASWIEQRLNPETGSGEPSARERTLLTIFRNAVAITLIIITLMIVLAEIGINIGPLIAGAGVLGLAIGFGAQKLVQDIITGVFIQLENAINTGDVVTAGGVSGTAEKLTIRSLGIRDLSGTFHMIPFSSVDTVANYMRGFGYHVGEYGVAYREDIDEVIVRLREAFAELTSDPEQKAKILDDLEVHGVTALADSAVNIRVRIKTLPGAQWAVGRAYNRLVKYHLDAAGIEIPFPHMTMYFGQDKDGTAPPAPLTILSEKGGAD
ncbi:MAG: mechanosensitive ion channel domain-containing protein [Pseudohongiellaceae bacterium]